MNTKSIITATLTAVSMSSIAFADSVIADAMKAMMSDLKQIVATPSDTTKNPGLCDDMLKNIAIARAQTPEKVANLPADQQAGQETLYQQALDKLAAQVTQLKSDILAGNADAVGNDLNAVNQTKIAGHKAFKQN